MGQPPRQGETDADDEEGGTSDGARPDEVSAQAKQRGEHQLGSLGGGNHQQTGQVLSTVISVPQTHLGWTELSVEGATPAGAAITGAVFRTVILPGPRTASGPRLQSFETMSLGRF